MRRRVGRAHRDVLTDLHDGRAACAVNLRLDAVRFDFDWAPITSRLVDRRRVRWNGRVTQHGEEASVELLLGPLREPCHHARRVSCFGRRRTQRTILEDVDPGAQRADRCAFTSDELDGCGLCRVCCEQGARVVIVRRRGEALERGAECSVAREQERKLTARAFREIAPALRRVGAACREGLVGQRADEAASMGREPSAARRKVTTSVDVGLELVDRRSGAREQLVAVGGDDDRHVWVHLEREDDETHQDAVTCCATEVYLDVLELYVARHGETDWNRERRLQGSVDIPLNARGLEQARELAERLASIELEHIYVSGLQRAQQTAAALPDAIPRTVLEDLNERRLGEFEGAQLHLMDARQLELYQSRKFAWDDMLGNGESLRMHRDRVQDALRTIQSRHLTGRVAIVAHGATNALILSGFQGRAPNDIADLKIDNGSVFRVRLRGGVVLELNRF